MDIECADVRHRRGGRVVLDVPRLTIAGGRSTAILGPNGAGKTTLLRLIAGLERPTAGVVTIGGERVDVRRHTVAYVFQEDVFIRGSVIDNVALGLRVRGVGRAEARRAATEVLNRLGIEGLAARRADEISGGEARRASLARALMLHAPVLLLDEPLAGLDSASYLQFLDELPGVVANAGATTVVVTHRPDEALRLCEDVVVLVDGQVMAAGRKYDVATNPVHPEVCRALGYDILPLGTRQVAVPPGALRLAISDPQFRGSVAAVVDLVREWDALVVVAGARVHVRIPRRDAPPRPGEQIDLSAHTFYELK